jgi:16S rRNA G1207 methylase RsmC
MMNPPFEKKQDAQHVLKAYKCLKEGGVLVAIMSAGVTFREDSEYRQVRELATEIINLPETAFKESGTMVNAVMVKIERN